MLRLSEISAAYGPIVALRGVSLEVPDGQIVALLGANGAGKSSTLRVISGILHPSAGTVEYDGRRIDRRSAQEIVARGISHVPEGRELFAELTVEENLRLGAYLRRDGGIRRDAQRVYDYFPAIARRRGQSASSLSGGEQQMLAIGRALMSRPRLLLLDEPSLGLAPTLVRDIFQIIQAINKEEEVAVLVVEQNVRLALSIAGYGYVLETGKIVIASPAQDLLRDESVRKSYLGY